MKKSDKSYAELSDTEIMKTISFTKGFSTSLMRLTNIDRLQWVHRVALAQIGIDSDVYYYKTKPKAKNDENNSENESENKSEKSDTNSTQNINGKSDSKIENKSENCDKKDIEFDDLKCETFRSYNGKVYTNEELVQIMQNALSLGNEEIIGKASLSFEVFLCFDK